MKSKKNPQLQKERQSRAATCIQRHWKGLIVRRNYQTLIKKHRKQVFAAKELLQSERTYCQSLEFIVKKVMKPATILIKDPALQASLFSNIDQIWKVHCHFLGELETVMKDYNPHKTRLSVVILNHLFNKDNFKMMYTKYCYDYKNTDQAIKAVAEGNSQFKQHLTKIGLTSLNLSLESYMIKPVQRICKYGLITEEYRRNMPPDHIDYKEIQKTRSLIQKLVQETNDQVEEFLMRQRLLELKNNFPSFFNKIQSASLSQMRMYYESKQVCQIDILEEQQQIAYKSAALFENSVIKVPHKITQEPNFANFIFGRELTNSKYYKNIVQLVDSNFYTYLQFRQDKDKRDFMHILNNKLKQHTQQEYQDYIKINILGTETRESFFSSYTVYIVNIQNRGKINTIYPRFKDLLRVQDLMVNKGMKFDRLLLSKQSIISTLKSKTIEKRKHNIQQFLERIFNNCQVSQIKEIQDILGLSQLGMTAMMPRFSSQMQEVWVYLPNMQKVKVMMIIHESQIRDLKQLISQRMGMESTHQFQVFEVRNKNYNNKKLLYDGQPVKKIYDEQKVSASSINPFRDTLDYIYTRHFYLSKHQEEQLYKIDQARAQLELSVIHAQILNYRLDEEVMLTFMCLFSIYIHLPIDNSERLSFFIKEITKKNYKVSEGEFRIYFSEVKRMLSSQESLLTSLPLITIKIVSNSYLYQCLQFEVQVHHKIFSIYKKVFASIEESVVLGLHPQVVYLLSVRQKNIVAKFSYSQLSLLQTRPNSIVFEVLHNQTPLILKTPITFEIGKLFEIYRGRH